VFYLFSEYISHLIILEHRSFIEITDIFLFIFSVENEYRFTRNVQILQYIDFMTLAVFLAILFLII